MPTRDVIFNGGESSEDVSGDGRTIVGIAKIESQNRYRSRRVECVLARLRSG